MLQSTFLHLPRVGKTTELKLWKQGITDWDRFLAEQSIKGFSKEKKAASDQAIQESKRALMRGDSTFFTSLPSVEHWRLWETFKDEAIYVDIETNWHHDVTVLGIYDGTTVKHFIKGINLTKEAVQEHMQAKLIVTFNGASFDLPVLRRCFGDVIPAVPHVDLRHLAARLGHRGGLKVLECTLGLNRPDAVAGMSGMDALHLWDLYRASGEEAHLKKLLAYNEEDIVNLPIIAKKLVLSANSLSSNTHKV